MTGKKPGIICHGGAGVVRDPEAAAAGLAVGAVGLDARGGFAFGHTTPDSSYGYLADDELFMFINRGKRS